MLKTIFSLILVILILFFTSCSEKTYPIAPIDIIGEYEANKGSSILKINKDGTFNQEILINELTVYNSGRWEILSPEGENNIRLSFMNFILHMNYDSTVFPTLRKPKEFITYAEKNKGQDNKLYISICYTSFCFIKNE